MDDPNIMLREIREARADLDAASDRGSYAEAAERLAQRVQDLDVWLTRGGYLPTPWWAGREVAGRNR